MNTGTKLSGKLITRGSLLEKKVIGWSLVMACLLTFLDQATKIWTIRYFGEPGQKEVVVIQDFFNLVYVHNNGAAWNMLAGQTWILLAISIVVLIGILVKLYALTEGWKERYFALFMIVSGIVGNSADRSWNGGNVIDFLDFTLRFGDWSYRWPAFNVADSAICVGAGLYILSSFIRPEKEKSLEA